MFGGYPWVVVLGLPKKKLVRTKAMVLAPAPLGSKMQPSWSQTRCGTVMPLRLFSQWNGVFLDWCPFGPKWCSSEKWTCPLLGAVSCFRDSPTQRLKMEMGLHSYFEKWVYFGVYWQQSQKPCCNMGDWGPIFNVKAWASNIFRCKKLFSLDPGPPCSNPTGFEPLIEPPTRTMTRGGKNAASHP